MEQIFVLDPVQYSTQSLFDASEAIGEAIKQINQRQEIFKRKYYVKVEN